MRVVGAWLLFVSLGGMAQAQLPTSGVQVPELTVFDQAMTYFMQWKGIEAGTLGISYQGQVVFHRGYGWQDRDKTTPLPPNAMMRLASVTKPITAAAVNRLATEGDLSLDDYAINTGQAGGGIVNLPPYPSLGDPRLSDVTVRHLLQHRGGWDRSQAPDYTWQDVRTAQTLGIPSPPSAEEKIQYILGKPLEHDPGSTRAYSNEGYMILGEVIEETTGRDFADVVQSHVFDPINVPAREVELGRTFPQDRNPREPWYQSTNDGLATNVFDLDGPRVPWPDGGWHHEARASNGGLIASTKAILAYLDEYQVSGDEIGTLRSGNEGADWRLNHTGSQNGTNTLARQRGDGISYVVMFNERPESGSSYTSQMRTVLDTLFDLQEVWPEALVEPGDGDGDSWLTTADIEAFVTAVELGDENAFLGLYPDAQYLAFDFDDDGLVTLSDAQPFVDYMKWSGFSEDELAIVTVPEPETWVLAIAATGFAFLIRSRGRKVQLSS